MDTSEKIVPTRWSKATHWATSGNEVSWIRVTALVLVLVASYWVVVGWRTRTAPNYMQTEAQVVLEMSASRILGPIFIKDPTGKWGDYTIFAPTGFNLAAAVDRLLVAPIVLGPRFDATAFASARRLLVVHALMIGLATAALYLLLRRAYGYELGVAAALIYFGLNDGYVHALYFVATLGLYTLLLGAILSVGGLISVLVQGPTRAAYGSILAGLVVAVLAHGQSASLPVAMIASSLAMAYLWDIPFRQWRIAGLFLPIAALGLYFAMRLGTGLSETSRVTESQYVFSYPSLLLMLEEMAVNASHHIANAVDSLIMPWPMYSVAVLQKIDMNAANQYNLVYSPWPNMHYRLLGSWYVGVLFGLSLWGTAWLTARFRELPRSSAGAAAVIGLALLWLGFFMHIPVMHRDYFEQPGFNVGYKSVLSVLGLALVVPFVWRHAVGKLSGRLSPVALQRTLVGICAWFAVCAIGKIVFRPPYGYPW